MSVKRSPVKEMFDKLHGEEPIITIDLCQECGLVLKDIDKYCPECGEQTELGVATEVLESMGEDEEDDRFTIGQDTKTGIPNVPPPNPVPLDWYAGDPYEPNTTKWEHNTTDINITYT